MDDSPREYVKIPLVCQQISSYYDRELVRSGLPISRAVFAISNITIQIHIECNVA